MAQKGCFWPFWTLLGALWHTHMALPDPQNGSNATPGMCPDFCIVIAIFVNGANEHYTRGYIFPIGTTPQKKGSFFGAHPCFWPFWAIPTLEVYLPLILVRFQ